MSDHEMIIISALRYALPRRSYIMSVTEMYIDNMLKTRVSQNFINVAIQDIKDHYRLSDNSVIDSGRYNWNPLLDRLKSLLK